MTISRRNVLASLLAGPAGLRVAAQSEGWISLFDGKSLNGWKASEKPENWTVEEGTITGRGERSHLFFVGADGAKPEEFENLEFIADIKLNKGGNSGMYFRTEFGPGWPKGYEAQVNNSSGDPVKTGSLYYLKKIFEQHVPEELEVGEGLCSCSHWHHLGRGVRQV